MAAMAVGEASGGVGRQARSVAIGEVGGGAMSAEGGGGTDEVAKTGWRATASPACWRRLRASGI